jgi:hypothetical protein
MALIAAFWTSIRNQNRNHFPPLFLGMVHPIYGNFVLIVLIVHWLGCTD